MNVLGPDRRAGCPRLLVEFHTGQAPVAAT